MCAAPVFPFTSEISQVDGSECLDVTYRFVSAFDSLHLQACSLTTLDDLMAAILSIYVDVSIVLSRYVNLALAKMMEAQ